MKKGRFIERKYSIKPNKAFTRPLFCLNASTKYSERCTVLKADDLLQNTFTFH